MRFHADATLKHHSFIICIMLIIRYLQSKCQKIVSIRIRTENPHVITNELERFAVMPVLEQPTEGFSAEPIALKSRAPYVKSGF